MNYSHGYIEFPISIQGVFTLGSLGLIKTSKHWSSLSEKQVQL